MYLIDTNVWLERLMDGEYSEEVDRFLLSTPGDQFHVADISWYTIASILGNLKQDEDLSRFVMDVFVDSSVSLIHLEPQDMKHVLREMNAYSMEFDEAYIYVAADKYNLPLVSYNETYDQTPRRRKTPKQILLMQTSNV